MVERLIASEDKAEKEKRDTCKVALEDTSRNNNNCPIVLEKMTFNIFSDYMSTKNSKNSIGYLSSTSYGGVQSSLTCMYCMSVNTMGV